MKSPTTHRSHCPRKMVILSVHLLLAVVIEEMLDPGKSPQRSGIV